MRLAEPSAAGDEQRIVARPTPAGRSQRCCVGEFVRGAHHEVRKRVLRVEVDREGGWGAERWHGNRTLDGARRWRGDRAAHLSRADWVLQVAVDAPLDSYPLLAGLAQKFVQLREQVGQEVCLDPVPHE